ncbi:NRDE family protein [Ectopseudomonas khazarica]|uniref:NRDE family protein n=1 Tax=Ectopseudomonas khazarica TaxID=2502979 RepID=UPI0006459407
MCLIVFAWQPQGAMPLRLAANRDEFYARPSAALSEWQEAPGVFAGRDLQAGGTWLGITAEGRFAALTNIRDPGQKIGPRSRGELTADYLRGQSPPEAYLQEVAKQAHHYAGFNLLLGERDQLWYLNSQEGRPRRLEPGIYGLCNAGLDTPWPKLLRAREALRERLANPHREALLQLLGDAHQPPEHLLPQTGVGLETERLLSSIFITSATYGTRASTVLQLARDGHWQISERTFGPQGVQQGEVHLQRPTS